MIRETTPTGDSRKGSLIPGSGTSSPRRGSLIPPDDGKGRRPSLIISDEVIYKYFMLYLQSKACRIDLQSLQLELNLILKSIY